MPRNRRIQGEKMADKDTDSLIEKLKKVLASFGGKKPDLENTDYSNYIQSEKTYQEQQKRWLESVKRKKEKREKSRGKKRGS